MHTIFDLYTVAYVCVRTCKCMKVCLCLCLCIVILVHVFLHLCRFYFAQNHTNNSIELECIQTRIFIIYISRLNGLVNTIAFGHEQDLKVSRMQKKRTDNDTTMMTMTSWTTTTTTSNLYAATMIDTSTGNDHLLDFCVSIYISQMSPWLVVCGKWSFV